MLFQFQLRRGTASEWTASNPILKDGEPGIESDTKKFKIGNGITTWTSLPYYVTADAMYIYVNEAFANAAPIGPEVKTEIVETVLSALELPDLTLVWENAKA